MLMRGAKLQDYVIEANKNKDWDWLIWLSDNQDKFKKMEQLYNLTYGEGK